MSNLTWQKNIEESLNIIFFNQDHPKTEKNKMVLNHRLVAEQKKTYFWIVHSSSGASQSVDLF